MHKSELKKVLHFPAFCKSVLFHSNGQQRAMCDDTKRLFLWAVPRSISTAFFRAMMHRQRTKVLLEPFSRAYYYGPERQSKRYADQPVQPADSYEAVMRDVEQKYDGMHALLSKLKNN